MSVGLFYNSPLLLLTVDMFYTLMHTLTEAWASVVSPNGQMAMKSRKTLHGSLIPSALSATIGFEKMAQTKLLFVDYRCCNA